MKATSLRTGKPRIEPFFVNLNRKNRIKSIPPWENFEEEAEG